MRWVKDNIIFIAIAVGLIVLFIVAVMKQDKDASMDSLVESLKLEKEVINAKAEASRQAARLGHQQAAVNILRQHEGRLTSLDEEAKKKVKELADDPEALVEHLLRSTL